MDMNTIYSILIATICLAVIVGICYVFNKNKKIKDITDIITKFIPTFMDTTEKVLQVTNPEMVDKFNEVEKAVNAAVKAVEQLSKKSQMTSEEKKELAIEYYHQIAQDLNLPVLTDLQEKTLDIFIENVVMGMNQLEGKK